MKKILLSILTFLILGISFAQKIDTTEIKSVRYEWQINKKSNDSTLTQILSEYKNGILKDEIYDIGNPKSKFGYYFIFERTINSI